MKRFRMVLVCAVVVALCIAGVAQVTTFTGSFADGATYKIEVPANWNRTLLLYSHGYIPPGSPNIVTDVGDRFTGAYLLSQGFALAGSSYATTGWAVEDAFRDQVAVLSKFAELVGQRPTRTIAWGQSLGGLITAGLVQKFPTLFTAALPMCGVTGGGVGVWNTALDSAFAFATLVGSGTGLQLVHITNPSLNLAIAEQLLASAQSTPQGRARIALAAALSDEPKWFGQAGQFSSLPPEPSPTDYDAQESNQFLWLQNFAVPFELAFRAELEGRAGGNPSWNTGVDYQRQLQLSTDYEEVQALYAEAGLSLDDDLQVLANPATRISADASAVAYLANNIVFNGQIQLPVLTMHTTADGLVAVEHEQAYKAVVTAAHDNELLREIFVHRAGHCNFTPAEQIAALQVLIRRVETSKWQGLDAGDLNDAAAALGSLNPVAPAFINFDPGPFLRPFTSADQP